MTRRRAEKILSLKSAKNYIESVAGKDGYKIFEYLIKKGREIEEFKIAEDLNLQINYVRSLLYKLYEKKLVSSSRRRDKEKGWFIYSWLAHPEQLLYLLIEEKKKEIKKLKESIPKEDRFICPGCKRLFTYKQAMECMFICPYCGKPLELKAIPEIKKEIEKQVQKLEKEIKEMRKLKPR